MPSLRKRVSSYFRQLSFHNEPREKKNNLIENTFINKYLQGEVGLKEGPAIIYGKNPTDLPNYDVATYKTGPNTIIGCYTGPNGGLTTVQRTEKHLSMLDQEIDFIDTQDEPTPPVCVIVEPKKSPKRNNGSEFPLDNTSMLIKVAGHSYNVTNRTSNHNKCHSLGSLSDFIIEIDTTKINHEMSANNNVDASFKIKENCDKSCDIKLEGVENVQLIVGEALPHLAIAKSKSEGNPFGHKKRGKITRLTIRPNPAEDGVDKKPDAITPPADSALPQEWNKKSDHVYGISDSLYDRNLVTKHKNGDPIADCFGIIARTDSAILAVADGVNWGEKASVAAKSAIHGCLHYLNKTIFLDTTPFDNLIKMEGGGVGVSKSDTPIHEQRIGNTREIFVCLLRAFNCAHDLILENQGMLTTLTVAVILPLKQSNVIKQPTLGQPPIRTHKWDRNGRRVELSDGGKFHTIERNINLRSADEAVENYICCVCNVGDTLAYVYSQKYGIRELTKGSHDINCNRDMRDALGALGPVDGINPELSNLTLSITTIQKGDIVMIASDGLTDNFDPNVCKFTIIHPESATKPRKTTTQPQKPPETNQPPIKPPRKQYKNRDNVTRESSSNEVTARAHNKASSSFDAVKVAPTRLRTATNDSSAFARSKTSIDMRKTKTIQRNPDGIPYVTPLQRYELTLLLIEDILKRGISGKENQCVTAKRLCENLVSFTINITNAKRRTLEDTDLYFNEQNGVLVEVTNQEKKVRRKKGLDNVQKLPGKLDHVTAVAYNVGNVAY